MWFLWELRKNGLAGFRSSALYKRYNGGELLLDITVEVCLLAILLAIPLGFWLNVYVYTVPKVDIAAAVVTHLLLGLILLFFRLFVSIRHRLTHSQFFENG